MDNKKGFFKKIINLTSQNFMKANTKELILYKAVVLVFSFAMILCASFLLRDSILSNRLQQTQSGFIGINHQYNKGVGFSMFSSNSTFSVYMVQILPCIIFLIIILFSKNKLSILMCSFVFAGGMSNVIDRAIPDK
jgi:lipoprotein signal peptidase